MWDEDKRIVHLEKRLSIRGQRWRLLFKVLSMEMKKEHIVPISKEVALLIKVREDKVSWEFPDSEYLFPRKDGSPLKQETFRDELNKLAYEQKIVDKSGEIYRFHA